MTTGGIHTQEHKSDQKTRINYKRTQPDVPYPPLDVWGGLMKTVLLWEYEYLESGPLEYLRYLLLLLSVGVVAALIDLGIKILTVLANLVPFT